MKNEIITVETTAVVGTKNFFATDLVNRWISFAGVSEKSASTYKTALKQLAKFFSANAITNPRREDLEQWRDELIAAKKSPATIQLYLTATKIFYRWLAQENLYPNIADHLKNKVKINHEHKKDALTAKQAGTLLKTVDATPLKSKRFKEIKIKRDKAIVALMFSCGLRCVEVTRLDVSDMQPEFGRTYLLIQGKGHASKDAKVLLPTQVETLIREYLNERGASDGAMFVSHANRNNGARISTQVISKMVKANLRAAGMDSPRLCAHALRHTAATTMILAGVELTKVQQVLRHVNINTTMIYNNAVERMKNTAEQTAANAIFDTLSA